VRRIPVYSTKIKETGKEKIIGDIRTQLGIEITEDDITYAFRPNVIEVDMPRELTADELKILYRILEQDERRK